MAKTLTDLVVEPARIADVDRVAPLFDAYRQFYGAHSDLPAARTFLAQRLTCGESVVLLASFTPRLGDERVAAGFVQLYPSFSSLALRRSIVLNDLFVAPAWRGHGVAWRLVGEVVVYAREVSAVGVELATQHTNDRALRLYQAHGFVRDTDFIHLGLTL